MVRTTRTFSFTTDIPGCESLGPVDVNSNTGDPTDTVVCSAVDWGDTGRTIQEDVPIGWHLVPVESPGVPCDVDGGGTVTDISDGYSVDPVNADADVTCYFVNGSDDVPVDFYKECDPSDDAGEFGLLLTPRVDNAATAAAEIPVGDSQTPLTCGGHLIRVDLPQGTYDVSEVGFNATDPNDYDPTYSDDCDGGELEVSVVQTGVSALVDPLTCTVTNERTGGGITIIKQVPGQDPTNFYFTDNIPDCDIGPLDDDIGTNDALNATECLDVPAGSYFVRENTAPGWDLVDIVCETDLPSTEAYDIDVSSRQVDIDLQPREHVTCTFYNDPRGGDIPEDPDDGSITIVKETTGPTGRAFRFSSLDFGNFLLYKNQSRTYDGLAGGVYVVSEQVPNEWALLRIVCDSPDVDISLPTVEISLDDGDHVTCVFTNHSTSTTDDDDPEDPTATPTKTPTPTATATSVPSATPTQPSSDVGGEITPPNTGDGGVSSSRTAWLVLVTAGFAGVLAIGLRLASHSRRGPNR